MMLDRKIIFKNGLRVFFLFGFSLFAVDTENAELDLSHELSSIKHIDDLENLCAKDIQRKDESCVFCAIQRAGQEENLRRSDFRHYCSDFKDYKKFFKKSLGGSLSDAYGLDPKKYEGFSFDEDAPTRELQNHLDTLLSEGNATIVDKTNRVHSGPMTSCSFIIIHYKDDQKQDKYFLSHLATGINGPGDKSDKKENPIKKHAVGPNNFKKVLDSIIPDQDPEKYKIESIYVFSTQKNSYPLNDLISKYHENRPDDEDYKNFYQQDQTNFQRQEVHVLFREGKIFYTTDKVLSEDTHWQEAILSSKL